MKATKIKTARKNKDDKENRVKCCYRCKIAKALAKTHKFVQIIICDIAHSKSCLFFPLHVIPGVNMKFVVKL